MTIGYKARHTEGRGSDSIPVADMGFLVGWFNRHFVDWELHPLYDADAKTVSTTVLELFAIWKEVEDDCASYILEPVKIEDEGD